jgi:hypothetical protein
MMKGTATDAMMRLDLRRRRAMGLTAAVLRELPDHCDPHRWKEDVHDALMRVFAGEGVEVLTDYDRTTLGLPPRGPDGWTPEELLALERRHLELLTRPPEMIIPMPTWFAER